MFIRSLGTYGYRGRFDEEWSEALPAPTWAEIEASIRRLDAGEFTGAVLHQNDRRDGEPAQDCLAVVGGMGAYLVNCHRPKGRGAALITSSTIHGEELVAVCRRDQGIWVPERKVCRDIELVLFAARHYATSGQLSPECYWE